MRWLMVGFVLLLSGAVSADDVPVARKAAQTRLAAEEAAAYVAQLEHVFVLIETNYVRPVLRSDLAGVGLRGLYQTARRPVPGSLELEVGQARAQEIAGHLVQGISGPGFDFSADRAGAFQQAANARLAGIAARTRESLGHVEELREHAALLASLRAITAWLDPHCGVVGPGAVQALEPAAAGQGFGMSVLDSRGAGPLLVRSVVAGSPAQQAGMRPGDRIVKIDGKAVQGNAAAAGLLNPAPVALPPGLDIPLGDSLQKPPGPVTLAYERAGARERRIVRLEPAFYRGETVLGVQRRDNNDWDYWLDRQRKVALVRIAGLSETTPTELNEVLTRLSKEDLGGLIVDLRWCPGGLLRQSVATAQLLVGNAKVATVRDRLDGTIEFSYVAERAYTAVPLLALVNGATSGGAELIAAAVQDNQRGIVAGQRTLGKGSVQKQLGLSDSWMLKLTTGTFIRPSGKNLHRFPSSKPTDDWGVRPDPGREFRVSADVSRQLQEWYQLQTLRPGKSREILPLDDPANDPQRQEALRLLLRKIENGTQLQGGHRFNRPRSRGEAARD